jgi:transcriptional regulator GlxA family with amidase domain
MATMRPTRTVGVLLFPGFEPLDVFGPVEAFVISRFPGAGEEPPHPFRVVMIGASRDPIPMTGGPRVTPDHDFGDCPRVELLLVPGGMGTRTEHRNERLLGFLREQSRRAEVVASVCTGAVLLGCAGLLDGQPATTNRRAFDWVASTVPSARWDRTVRWVDAGRVVTSAGVSAGTDMALHLVGRLLGAEAAATAARRMEYSWNPDANDVARPVA